MHVPRRTTIIPTKDLRTAAVAVEPTAPDFVLSGTGARPFTMHVNLPVEALNMATRNPR
jgi:hypothetical protein